MFSNNKCIIINDICICVSDNGQKWDPLIERKHTWDKGEVESRESGVCIAGQHVIWKNVEVSLILI